MKYLKDEIRIGRVNETSEIQRWMNVEWTVFGKLQIICQEKQDPWEKYMNNAYSVETYGAEILVLTKKCANKLRVA